MGNNVVSLFYHIIVAVCVFLSITFSYYGLDRMMGSYALLGALLIGLVLCAADILLRTNRLRGRSLMAPLALLLIGASLSFVSNFNHLYTQAMQRDVATLTMAQSYDNFHANLSSARVSLTKAPQYREIQEQRQALDSELEQLYEQITDPNNSGIGPRARQHIDRVYEILGRRLTQYARPGRGAAMPLIEAWYQRFANAAREELQLQFRSGPESRFARAEKMIVDALAEYERPQNLSSLERLDPNILSQMSARSNEIMTVVSTLTARDIQARPIDMFDGRLGEIEYSLHNGFIERPNIGTTLVTTAISLVVDFLPLIFALAAFHNTDDRPQRRPGNGDGGRGSGTRFGRV